MKILIYSFNDKLGDGLQKISFLQYLKSIYPNSNITYTTTHTTTLKDILFHLADGYIDKFIENNNINSSFNDFFKKKDIFLHNSYDLIIDLQKVVLRTLNLKKISHNRFLSSAANFLLSSYKNKLNLDFKGIYIERFYFNILSLLIEKEIQTIPDIKIPYFETPIIRNDHKEKIIGIAPGAGDPIREWGINNYLEIAKSLEKYGYKVYFFLGPNENKYLDICRSNNFECPEWKGYKMISNNILFIMNLAKQIDCLLCNDGGTSWLFEFTGIKTFKIFGVTNQRKFSRPNYTNSIQVSDFGYNDLQSFPVSLYKKNLLNYLKDL